jgi:hypothetical protein
MRHDDMSRRTERPDKMGTDETIGPCHENAFALKIHREKKRRRLRGRETIKTTLNLAIRDRPL